jgi:endonuclease YncB( thermonuclease family)
MPRTRRRAAAALLVTLLAFIAPAARAAPELTDRGEGEVVGIVDGDTIDVLVDAELAMRLGFPKRKSPLSFRMRLDQVDTPERGQPWGKNAKEALSDLIFGKRVRFVIVDIDRYERAVAQVYLGEQWVNTWLVEQGHAWAYRKYAEQPALYCSLEDKARQARRGLWSLPVNEREPPWLWRKHGDTVAFEPTLKECLAAAAH